MGEVKRWTAYKFGWGRYLKVRANLIQKDRRDKLNRPGVHFQSGGQFKTNTPVTKCSLGYLLVYPGLQGRYLEVHDLGGGGARGCGGRVGGGEGKHVAVGVRHKNLG